MSDIYDVMKKLEGKTLSTGGNGLWSRCACQVKIDHVTVIEDKLNGRTEWLLRVYWDPETWDVKQMGLIYTDKTFLNGFRRAMRKAGWKGKLSAGYTEQGMQGLEHVSMIVGVW